MQEQSSESSSFSSSLRTHLASIERRDWELWTLAMGSLVMMTCGLVLVVVPGLLTEERAIRLDATVSPAMLAGVLLLVGILLVYLTHKQVQVRRARLQSISETWSFEVSRMQLLVDPLTRVFNRASLNELLSRELQRVRRHRSSLALLYVDLDHFKSANSQHGHLFGDLVLGEVGGILKASTRGSDLVFRMGGDEFLIVLVDTNQAGADIVTRRIQHRVSEWNKTSPVRDFQLALSCGAYEVDSSLTFEQALEIVDRKMYGVKKSGQSSGAVKVAESGSASVPAEQSQRAE